MPFLESLKLLQVRGIRRLGQRGDPDQFVRHATQRRYDDDNHIIL